MAIQVTRRRFLSATAGAGLAASMSRWLPAAQPGRKTNVLFIAVDDLRPVMGCYGGPAITPAMDALAQRGTTLNHAYCQQAVCSPSRTSLLTGRRPDTTKIYNLEDHFRDTIPDVVTLPQHFKQNGYHAQAFGKIYHGGLDDKASWSVPHTPPRGFEYSPPERTRLARERAEARERGVKDPAKAVRGAPWEATDYSDGETHDGTTATRGIEALRELRDRPFFLALGFLKPHLPFVAPKKYFDLYPPEKIKLPPNYAAPQDVPAVAMHNFGELRQYRGIPKQGPLSDELALQLIRAYYAASSFMDAQLGRVLAELDRLGLRDNTAIILWGDHGWHLGEQAIWCKHSNFEIATRSPLLVSAPGQKNVSARTNALVEFVDIYPTLCDLCGLRLPEGLEGASFAPVMDRPDRPWKSAAFSQYPRARGIMGYSMRTARYRYTEWKAADKAPAAIELYDQVADPGETANLAARPGHQPLVAQLSRQLRAGWRAALPPAN